MELNVTTQPTSAGAFPYFGGKSKQLDWLLDKLPQSCFHFVDVFGGAGNVVLGYPAAKIRTYNDANGEIVNFFRVLREQPSELIQALELTPHSRFEYTSSFEDDQSCSIERARRTFIKMACSFGRTTVKSGYSVCVDIVSRGMSKSVRDMLNRIEALPQVVAALKTIQIECLDWAELIDKYESPNVFFYFDPPYLNETRTGGVRYGCELSSKNSHEQLVNRILSLNCSGWAISCYDHEIYEPLKAIGKVHTKQVFTNNNQVRHETLIVSLSSKPALSLFM